MFDIIDSKLGDKYSFNSFLTDYRFIVNDKRDAFPFDDGDHDDADQGELECDISSCFIVNRSESI